MPRFPFLSVQTLRENYPDEPFFLDPFKIEHFLDFLAGEPQLSEAARERRWKIVVFKRFLDDLPKARQTLAKQLFEVETLQVRREENWMVNELLLLIFRGDVSQQARAELLVLARRRQKGGKVLLISNSEHLSTLPNAQVFYFCGAAQIEEIRDLPVDFNLLQDLKLHARLVAAARKWEIGESANAVLEAMNALSTDCRTASGLSTDGITLMEAAFGHQQRGTDGSVVLCEGSSVSARNERLGYRDFFHGAVRALRNPNAHGESEGEWLQARFGDKITVAKTLCFLSLLFEKLESRPQTGGTASGGGYAVIRCEKGSELPSGGRGNKRAGGEVVWRIAAGRSSPVL